jgi:hypothetical protein
MILFEGAFSGPLYELFQWDLQSPMAFGQHKSYVRGVMHSLERYNTRVGLDSSRFDSSLNPWIISRMFDVLETWFAPKHRVFFKLIRHYFVNTPILMPDGNVYVTKRGVPSGSEFTQWIDSAATYFLVQYAMYRTTNRTVPYGSLLVLGDDAAFGTNESVQPMEFASAMWELGVTMNVEKTVFARRGSPCHFLGHEWLRGFMTRPVEEIAQRAVFPERNATLRDAHWFTRLFSICMSCDNGLAFLMNMFGFHHIGQLYLVPLPGRRPLSGLEAANARGDPGPEHGVVGNLPWTLPRS